MRLLVLGGSAFVGRAVVDAAIGRGWQVTTFNRGASPDAHPAAEVVRGDRLVPADLCALSDRHWDAVVDTWSGIPRAVRDSAAALSDRFGHYCYVSSRSGHVRAGRTHHRPVRGRRPAALVAVSRGQGRPDAGAWSA